MSQAGYTPIQLYYSTTASTAPSAGNLANGELALNITDGRLFYKDNGGVVRVLATAAGSAGDVVGPGSSTDNALVRFDGTTGKLVQSSVGVLSDAGALSGLTSVAATTFTGALTGNASTATTLQTSRTIWGQSFDGSANVTGALTGVTDLTASGSLTLNGGTANGVAYLNGSKVLTTGSALTFDGTLLINTAGGITGAGLTSNATGGEGGQLTLLNPTNTGTVATLDVVNATTARLFTQVNDASLLIGQLSGTGGTVAFHTAATERMRLDASGNLGLGVTPSAWGAAYRAIDIQFGAIANTSSGSVDVAITQNAFFNGSNWITKYSGQSKRQVLSDAGFVWHLGASQTAGNAISFTQAMTLDASGNLLVGTTSTQNARVVSEANGTSVYGFTSNMTAASGTRYHFIFRENSTEIGSITSNGSATAYNTSSDYRLKNITGPITNSGAYIDSLNPVEGTWKADGSAFVGLIAHEAQEASRTQVATGVKDGERIQGMDYSSAEIIANLIAEIQSLRQRLAAAGI